MEITSIPFHKLLEIERDDSEGVLKLQFVENKQNHIGTFHASAQFALAEVTSGLALQHAFPELKDKVVPILRKADAKYKNPAQSTISAHTSIEPEHREMFLQKLETKGRGLVDVAVEVKDESGIVTMAGTYRWYIQKRES